MAEEKGKKKEEEKGKPEGGEKPQAPQSVYALGEKIVPVAIENEMRDSYIDYAMSVIVGRALPDVRDGLKPVHRRILYAMQELGLVPNRPYKKSARVVGEVLGKYHPHGDLAVYETLVRMVQDFSLRYPLIDGQGNFGSVDGDNAAAMRYCVTGDTLIITEQGLVPIKDLSENGAENVSFSVLSRDRKIQPVVKWFDSGEHPTLKIATRGGFSLQGTHNHPLLTWAANEETGEPEFQWKLLGQLRVGDAAVIDRTADLLWPCGYLSTDSYRPKTNETGPRGRVRIKTLPGEFTEDLAFILGALVSEGTVKERELEFCNGDEEWLAEFDRCWERVFPDCRLHRFTRRPSSYGKKPYQTREIHSQFCIKFLRNLGLLPVRSRGKTVPWSVFHSPRSVAAAFLRAYFEGDGSISSSGSKMVELSCISTSETLVHQLQVLLLRFGIASTKRFDRHRGTHKLYIRGLENYRLFQEQVGFFSKRKNEKLASVTARYHKEYSATDFVPFISGFARSHPDRALRWKDGREFVLKHNFDRYPNLEKHASAVAATLEPDLQDTASHLFEFLLETRYLFDPIVKIEDGGINRVYSLKVESPCHSFVGNGFINHNTETRLASVSEELLSDIDKETVDFVPNFDESLTEPSLLPARLPNLLVNGSSGIAVGMATNIPPHNLNEVVDGLSAVIDNPEIGIKDLMKIIKGPDFPTGGIILGRDGIRSAYETGRGRILVRAKAVIETSDQKKKDAIVVTEIPYQVNKSNLIEAIAHLVEDKKIEGIHDIRDESDREGMRLVIELKRDAVHQIVLNQLYKHTQLQETFGVILLALVNGQPRVLNLKQMLEYFIEFRVEVVTRRTQFELDRAEKRAHILEGLKIAIANLDKIIKLIRQSKSPEIAKQELVKNFKLTEVQAKAILEMQLQRLTALEREKIDEEYLELIKKIEHYKSVLKSRAKILGIVKEESAGLVKKYGDERRTEIVAKEEEIEIEDLIAEEDVLITISHTGYIKRTPVTLYRKQRRGGLGVTGGGVKEEAEDFIEQLFLASTHDYILFFTNKGRVYWRKAYEIPQASRQARGKAIVNLLSLGADEKVSNFLQVGEFDEKHFIVMATKNGVIKKTRLSAYANPRTKGIIAITLKPKDELVSTRLTNGQNEIFLATLTGKAIRFPEKQVREMGRGASGVRGVRFGKKDEVIAMEIPGKDAKALTVTTKGFGKKSLYKDYRLQSRGGKGVINVKLTAKNGEVASVLSVKEEDEIILVTTGGMVVRCPVNQIRTSGRAAQGVRVIRLKEKDRVANAVRVVVGEEEDEN